MIRTGCGTETGYVGTTHIRTRLMSHDEVMVYYGHGVSGALLGGGGTGYGNKILNDIKGDVWGAGEYSRGGGTRGTGSGHIYQSVFDAYRRDRPARQPKLPAKRINTAAFLRSIAKGVTWG